MNVKVYENYDQLSKAIGDMLINILNQKPKALLCIAGGHTPLGVLRYLVQQYKLGNVQFNEATFVGLDEFVGFGRGDEGSCEDSLYLQFFERVDANEEQIFFFDAKSNYLGEECKKLDSIISEKGNLDFILLGVGMNGHLGFNEPRVSFRNYSHVVDLDDTTKTVGQKYFSEAKELSKGITLGIQHIMNAKVAVLMASGEKKAEIIKKTLTEPMTETIPATALQKHKNAYVLFDQAANEQLEWSNE